MAGRFLVYVEGQTEKVYVNELIREYHCEDLADVAVPPDNSPHGLLKELAKALDKSRTRGKNPYECGWLIFDQDYHGTYEQTITEAEKMPDIRVVWSNPCIEAWFLMHFPEGLKGLPFDSDLVVDSSQTKRKIDEIFFERVTVERCRKVIDPKSALSRLRKLCPGYRKNSSKGYFSSLRGRLSQAMSKEHNSADPLCPGSSFPMFIRFLQSAGGMQCSPETKPVLADSPARAPVKKPHPAAGKKAGQDALWNAQIREVPDVFVPVYKRLFKNQPFEGIDIVLRLFAKLRCRLKSFSFASDDDLCLAVYALMTAASGTALPHAPYIILNGSKTRNCSAVFEDLLHGVMQPASEFREPFPKTQGAAQALPDKPVQYAAFTAEGSLQNNDWLKGLWKRRGAPLVVISGKNLCADHLAPRALEIHFTKTSDESLCAAKKLAGEAVRIRRTLLELSLYLNNKGTRITGTNGKLFFWRSMAAGPLKRMGMKACLKKLNQNL